MTVDIENYSPDLSKFSFAALPGRLVEIEYDGEKSRIRESFVDLIKSKGLSRNVLSTLGHFPLEPVEALLAGERTLVCKLAGVKVDEILGLKSHGLY